MQAPRGARKGNERLLIAYFHVKIVKIKENVMKLHYHDSEISYAPMMESEMQYWLSKGYSLFQHHGIWWMKVTHHEGHRVLIQADAHEVRQLLAKRFYEQIGIIVRMKQEYRNAYSK